MKVLYAGDGPIGGAANYLYGVLRSISQVSHLEPGKILSPDFLRRKSFDLLILSDFSSSGMPKESQSIVVERNLRGMGIMMVGGWGSFSGPFGKWRGSQIENILPVRCKKRDDRINFSGGALMTPKGGVPFMDSSDFKNPPVICGMNEIFPKPEGKVVLVAREIRFRSNKLSLSRGVPLLVVQSRNGRSGALATDVAPHWCGGLVDWGNHRIKLKVKKNIQIEVGNLYVKFLANLARWLGGEI